MLNMAIEMFKTMAKLVVFETKTTSLSFDITPEDVKKYFSNIDYSEEQEKFISKLTGLSIEYLKQTNVDYYIDE